jgi:hypothetical protein
VSTVAEQANDGSDADGFSKSVTISCQRKVDSGRGREQNRVR